MGTISVPGATGSLMSPLLRRARQWHPRLPQPKNCSSLLALSVSTSATPVQDIHDLAQAEQHRRRAHQHKAVRSAEQDVRSAERPGDSPVRGREASIRDPVQLDHVSGGPAPSLANRHHGHPEHQVRRGGNLPGKVHSLVQEQHPASVRGNQRRAPGGSAGVDRRPPDAGDSIRVCQVRL